ncbi:MAG: Gfo/Idh/MocA family oxidoreductase [Trueperaceae bacterium]
MTITPGSRKSRPSPYLDVAVIGLGAIGTAHVDAVRNAVSTRLAAVVDIDRDRADTVASQEACQAFASIEEMLAQCDVDMVIVATPDHLHLEPVRLAATAGKHVLLEKPLATSVEDARAILDIVERTGIQFTVGHCLRFDPKYVEVHRRIRAGEIGDVAGLYARRQNRISGAVRLRGRVSSLLFLAVHDIDILNWYQDAPPVAVYCASSEGVLHGMGYDVDDLSWTTIRYANGAVGVVESGWLLPETYPRTGHFELVATGSQGVARIDEFDEGLWIANASFQHIPLVDRLTPQVQHFAEAILNGHDPRVSGHDAMVAMEVALAAQISAAERREVALPLPRRVDPAAAEAATPKGR